MIHFVVVTSYRWKWNDETKRRQTQGQTHLCRNPLVQPFTRTFEVPLHSGSLSLDSSCNDKSEDQWTSSWDTHQGKARTRGNYTVTSDLLECFPLLNIARLI